MITPEEAKGIVNGLRDRFGINPKSLYAHSLFEAKKLIAHEMRLPEEEMRKLAPVQAHMVQIVNAKGSDKGGITAAEALRLAVDHDKLYELVAKDPAVKPREKEKWLAGAREFGKVAAGLRDISPGASVTFNPRTLAILDRNATFYLKRTLGGRYREYLKNVADADAKLRAVIGI